MTIEEQVESYVKRWFCQNNEILWERGGHYKEEVAALMVLLRERERAVLLESAQYFRTHEECWKWSYIHICAWLEKQAKAPR